MDFIVSHTEWIPLWVVTLLYLFLEGKDFVTKKTPPKHQFGSRTFILFLIFEVYGFYLVSSYNQGYSIFNGGIETLIGTIYIGVIMPAFWLISFALRTVLINLLKVSVK